jgi:uncharacterized protein GlcG (DUF336 family)
MAYQPDLTLAEARAIIDRALEKARQLSQAGSFVVVDAAGSVVSASRVGEGPPSSMWISRAKAYTAAVQRAPSARSATQWRERAAVFSSMQRLMRDEIFPGPGALPIRKNGRVVGAVSTGGGIGPWTEIPGVDLSELEGKNVEDYVIAHALQIPYENQHPEVERLVGPKVEERKDDLPHSLDTARRYADRVLNAAREKGLRVGVAVVDEVGQLMQMDRMDGAPLAAPDLAEAKAMTALYFQRPSQEVQKNPPPPVLAEIKQIVHFKVLTGGGGVSITQDGVVVGAIGVHGGGGGDVSEALARAGLG